MQKSTCVCTARSAYQEDLSAFTIMCISKSLALGKLDKVWKTQSELNPV